MESSPTLSELMLHAEQFCMRVESAVAYARPQAVDKPDELALKISQCRGALTTLQTAYDNDELSLSNVPVSANFRSLVVTLLWVAFEARHVIDYRIFRTLVMIESNFLLLLATAQ